MVIRLMNTGSTITISGTLYITIIPIGILHMGILQRIPMGPVILLQRIHMGIRGPVILLMRIPIRCSGGVVFSDVSTGMYQSIRPGMITDFRGGLSRENKIPY